MTGKRVLLRTDFNVPVKQGVILDEYKIDQQLPTIKYLREHNAKIIIVTHLGEPKMNEPKEKYSVKPIADYLEKIFKIEIKIIKNFSDFSAGTIFSRMKNKEIVILENIRFYRGEMENSQIFAKKLSQIADLYVNDAFAVSHRQQASISAIKNFLPSYAGLLLEQEVINLSRVLHSKKPLIAIIGGAKIATKIKLIKNLQKKGATILIGGALANNFLVAHKMEVGKSLVDQKSIIIATKLNSRHIIIPIDVVVSTSNTGQACARSINSIGKKEYIFDIGPETISLYAKFINKAKTIIWNGPLGFFEIKKFGHGTMAIAKTIAARSRGSAFGVAGGGETVAALRQTKMMEYLDWISTGGGAMLAFLGGEPMPGLKNLVKN